MDLSLLLNPELRYQKMTEYMIQLDIEFFKLKNSRTNIDTAIFKLGELYNLRLKYQNIYAYTEESCPCKSKFLDTIKMLDNQYNLLLAAKNKEDFIFKECGARLEAIMEKLNTIRDFGF
jgi:hypothetical protein